MKYNFPTEIVTHTDCKWAEGPLWCPVRQCLYWVDIERGHVFSYIPSANSTNLIHREDCAIGGMTLQRDGSMLLFLANGGIKCLRDGKTEFLVREIPEVKATNGCFNDVAADPEGRVFCGTVNPDEKNGFLYRLERDRTLVQILGRIGCANGMAWSLDYSKMYFTDSVERAIYSFEYDRPTGAISNQTVFVKTQEGQGVPDGLTVDSEGNIWSARCFGSCVSHFSQDGEEMGRIELPTANITSLIFGGQEYKDLYITSSEGSLFRCKLDIAGRPELLSAVQ